MLEYVQPDEEFDEDRVLYYSEDDIERCRKLLVDFVTSVETASNWQEAVVCVKKAVIALNKLNEECRGQLIETDQREEICHLLVTATHLRGFNAEKTDITYEWRKW